MRAWDLPTRLFHWLLVLLIASAWVSFRYAEVIGDFTLKWHRWNGYAVLVLIVFRVIWGFAGSSTSRFATFVHWPWAALGYLLDMMRGRSRHFLGHNPLGAYMALALLTLVALQGGLGLFAVEHNDSGAYGPLYRLVSEETYKSITSWHRKLFYYGLLALIPLHVAANILYGLVKKDPLIRAMITGTKPAASYADVDDAAAMQGSPMRRALVCVALAVAIVFGGILALGGRLV